MVTYFVTCFDRFGFKNILKEIKEFSGFKNIMTNIYKIQVKDSMICEKFVLNLSI